jgi:hypothetical protein
MPHSRALAIVKSVVKLNELLVHSSLLASTFTIMGRLSLLKNIEGTPLGGERQSETEHARAPQKNAPKGERNLID